MKLARWLRGVLPVAAKEWKTTFLSLRLVIVVVVLALAILGSTFTNTSGSPGTSGTPEFVTYNFEYSPDLNTSHLAFASFAAAPTGEHLSGKLVQLVNSTTRSPGGGFVKPSYNVLSTNSTDSAGWVRFTNLWSTFPNMTLGIAYPDLKEPPYCCIDTHRQLSATAREEGWAIWQELSLAGSSEKIFSAVFLDTLGVPLSSSDVFILQVINASSLPRDFSTYSPPGGWTSQYRVGTTDSSGYYINPKPYGSGLFIVHMNKGGLNDTVVFGSLVPSTTPAGPDGALYSAGSFFIPLILPLLGQAVAYDAVAGEKSEGTLELLLSKPVSRYGVALGKMFGVFGSELAPVVAIILGSAGLIWIRTGQSPTASFLFGFLASAIFLSISYSLLFLVISALSRSLGIALLVSITFLLLFGFLWNIVTILIAGLVGPSGSIPWFQAIVATSLVSPTEIFRQFLSYLAGGLTTASGTLYVPPSSWLAAGAIAWIVGPFTLFVWAMKYRVTEA